MRRRDFRQTEKLEGMSLEYLKEGEAASASSRIEGGTKWAVQGTGPAVKDLGFCSKCSRKLLDGFSPGRHSFCRGTLISHFLWFLLKYHLTGEVFLDQPTEMYPFQFHPALALLHTLTRPSLSSSSRLFLTPRDVMYFFFF